MPRITNTSRVEQVLKTKDGKYVGLASGETDTIDVDTNDRTFQAKVRANNIALGTEEQTQKVKDKITASAPATTPAATSTSA